MHFKKSHKETAVIELALLTDTAQIKIPRRLFKSMKFLCKRQCPKNYDEKGSAITNGEI